MTQQIIANWNGEQLPLEEVRVSVLDRAFLFGDSVYEVVRIYGGRAWHLSEHLARLKASLRELQIEFEIALVESRLKQLVKTSGLQEALVYVQITRGAAARHHYYVQESSPNCLIYVEPFDDPYEPIRKEGGVAITYPDIRWARNDIKCTSLAANCMAANAAKQRGCLEAILIKDEMVTEGSHSSVFGVMNGKLIVSPSSSAVLPGITKKQVIELCRRTGVEMEEGRLKRTDLTNVQELFITSTPEEIIGIVEVDDLPIADGKPGPITLKLQEAFRRTVQEWLQAELMR